MTAMRTSWCASAVLRSRRMAMKARRRAQLPLSSEGSCPLDTEVFCQKFSVCPCIVRYV